MPDSERYPVNRYDADNVVFLVKKVFNYDKFFHCFLNRIPQVAFKEATILKYNLVSP